MQNKTPFIDQRTNVFGPISVLVVKHRLFKFLDVNRVNVFLILVCCIDIEEFFAKFKVKTKAQFVHFLYEQNLQKLEA